MGKALFFMGHSAGSIMSGPNILTATWKCIDSFSHCCQPYNAPWVRLPPSEKQSDFFVGAVNKNDLRVSRERMLALMNKYKGWTGFRVVEPLTFPHYDSRPTFASFPQSAETYLSNTSDGALFKQEDATLLVNGTEPDDVKQLREKTCADKIEVLLIANGHSVVLSGGGVRVAEVHSPEEEGQPGPLHFDTYMPVVDNGRYEHYEQGMTKFEAGMLAKAVAGDRSATKAVGKGVDEVDGATNGAGSTSGYGGSRVLSRLAALGLPGAEMGETGCWRTKG